MTDKPRLCPHCGKDTRLAKKPRDLGLLLNHLLQAVPLEVVITEEVIEQARLHCQMKPERLAALRSPDHARHWRYLVEKRERRLAWAKEHGEAPTFTPRAPGEPDYTRAVEALRLYRKHVRPLLVKMKRRPAAQLTKMANDQIAANKHTDVSRESDLKAIYQSELQVAMKLKAFEGTLTVADYRAIQQQMAAVAGKPSGKAPAATGCVTKKAAQRAPGEHQPGNPAATGQVDPSRQAETASAGSTEA